MSPRRCTTCSGSAELSTSIAFWPPVSAISTGSGPSLRGERAVDEPGGLGRTGEGDTGDARIGQSASRRSSSRARERGAARRPGCRPACSRRTIAAATSGVCSAGFAITALPAASAAATWPVKIASGKFQGLMQAKTPRPRRASRCDSPVGPGSSTGLPKSSLGARRVVAQEIHGLAHFGDRVRHGLAGLARRRWRRSGPCRVRAGRRRRAASAPAQRPARDPIPAARPPPGRSPVRQCGIRVSRLADHAAEVRRASGRLARRPTSFPAARRSARARSGVASACRQASASSSLLAAVGAG